MTYIAALGPGTRDAEVHAAIQSADPLDFSALCGITFNAVYHDGGEHIDFGDFLDGLFANRHICARCTELYEQRGDR